MKICWALCDGGIRKQVERGHFRGCERSKLLNLFKVLVAENDSSSLADKHNATLFSTLKM
jgi:hypothetical protein